VTVEREDRVSGLDIADLDLARILGPLGYEDPVRAPVDGAADPGLEAHDPGGRHGSV
jgi:hypothetical protein